MYIILLSFAEIARLFMLGVGFFAPNFWKELEM